MSDELERSFLAAIGANPNDAEARSVYADWLDERGDLRGEYLRLEAILVTGPARLVELAQQIAPDWIAAITRRCDVVMLAPGTAKITAIKAVREVTGIGLKEAKDLVEGEMPQVLRTDVRFDEAQMIVAHFGATGARVIVTPHAAPVTGMRAPPTSSGMATRALVIVRVISSQRLATMKAVREVSGVSLQEAKLLVDAVSAGEPRVVFTSHDREKIEAALVTLRACCEVEVRR